MTETTAKGLATTVMTTVVAQRIAARVGDLTLDQLKAAVSAALSVLDDEAAEEVGSGGDFDGPALATLNVMAEAVGLACVSRGDLEDEEDFFI